MTQPAGAPLFDAILRPHRSLGRKGLILLLIGMGAVSGAIGLVFLLNGAWPVFGFFGLDMIALCLAFRANNRAARAYERLCLTRRRLSVQRVGPRGRMREWRFQPHWLRVAMDDPPRHDSRLTLASHGRSVEVGAFLMPEERLEVAQALRAALARLRAPSPAPETA